VQYVIVPSLLRRLPSPRDGPLNSAMAALDEVKETIPDGIYKRITDGLMHLQTVIIPSIPSPRDDPLNSAMAALDEVNETIPDGIYKRIAEGLMLAYRVLKFGPSRMA
jgi:type III secretion system FlhB-like substrate exporter